LKLPGQCLIARSAREDRAFEAAAFLSRSQTKSCLLVRSSGQRRAILSALGVRLLHRRSQLLVETF
jgi:hypothetical protein